MSAPTPPFPPHLAIPPWPCPWCGKENLGALLTCSWCLGRRTAELTDADDPGGILRAVERDARAYRAAVARLALLTDDTSNDVTAYATPPLRDHRAR